MSAPRLPETFPDAWREVATESANELSSPVFTVRSHSRVYEHRPSTEAHPGLVDVELGTGLRSVFTTRLEFEPSLSSLGVSPDSRPVFRVARERARREFPRSVAEDGLVDVSHTDSRWLERRDGTRTRAFRYEVGVPLDPDVALAGTDDGTGAIRTGTAVGTRSSRGGRSGGTDRSLVLRAVLWGGIWPTEGAFAMAGGVYPDEPLASAVERHAPTRRPDPSVTVTVDRRRHRRVVARVIRTAV